MELVACFVSLTEYSRIDICTSIHSFILAIWSNESTENVTYTRNGTTITRITTTKKGETRYTC